MKEAATSPFVINAVLEHSPIQISANYTATSPSLANMPHINVLRSGSLTKVSSTIQSKLESSIEYLMKFHFIKGARKDKELIKSRNKEKKGKGKRRIILEESNMH